MTGETVRAAIEREITRREDEIRDLKLTLRVLEDIEIVPAGENGAGPVPAGPPVEVGDLSR